MLPTTGLVGGRGIGLSRLIDAIATVSPASSDALTVIARSTATKQSRAQHDGRWIASLRSQ
jgi:hypothetical protein